MGSTDRNTRRWGSSSPPPHAFAGGWSDLPDVLLLAALDRLPSLRDLFAVCAVCRSWRAVSRPFLSSAAGLVPPLLLRPSVNHRHHPDLDTRVNHRKRSRAYGRRYMPVRTRCDLICLGNPSALLRSMISSSTLGIGLIGSSYGQLIFSDGRRVVIADAFTGDELHAPSVVYDSQRLYYAALTAPLSSPDSYLLLCYDQKLLLWRAGDLDYGLHWLQPHRFHIVQVVACKEKIFALGSDERLHLIEFSPFSMKQLAVQWNEDNTIWARSFGYSSHLVECGGELMLVLIVHAIESFETYFKFTVYRLDLSEQPRWVKVDNLGHWALFIHEAGNGSMSCAHANRWGGRNNCIYYVGRGSGNWFVFPLDDTIDSTEPESPLYFGDQLLSKWPSPAWIYPSMLY